MCENGDSSGVAFTVRQPGTDTQGAFPLRRGCGKARRAEQPSVQFDLRVVLSGCGQGVDPEVAADSDPAPRQRPNLTDSPETPAELRDRERQSSSGVFAAGDPLGDRILCSIQPDRRFVLEGGGSLENAQIAYETWGTLNPDRSNAILVCHALTGDSHAAGRAGTGHAAPGWWDSLIGPGRPIDTDRYFVVCSNVLGGCQGSTGPASIDPSTGKHYGPTFPLVSIRDMVRAQALVADSLGIDHWNSVVGGSMGGMQVLEWAVMYPDRVGSIVVASSTAAASAQQIAWSHIGRSVIEADPGFNGGDYYDLPADQGPRRGLELARQIAQVTYRSDEVYTERFGRNLVHNLDFEATRLFDVESYLEYHGRKLVDRFDANSYLRLNRAMDFHDLGRGRGGVGEALGRIKAPVLTVSVRSDSLYPPVQQIDLHEGIIAGGGTSTFVDLDSPHGHDGFLIEVVKLGPVIREFLEENYDKR